jgi:hypothetical protein
MQDRTVLLIAHRLSTVRVHHLPAACFCNTLARYATLTEFAFCTRDRLWKKGRMTRSWASRTASITTLFSGSLCSSSKCLNPCCRWHYFVRIFSDALSVDAMVGQQMLPIQIPINCTIWVAFTNFFQRCMPVSTLLLEAIGGRRNTSRSK